MNKKENKSKNIKEKNNKIKKNKTGKADKVQNKSNVQKGKKGKLNALKVIFVILLLIVLSLGTFFILRMNENGWNLKGLTATILGHDSSTLENLPVLRFLVIGQSQNLTDTIMVCQYNPRTQQASILSIPRDTFTGKNKNSATAFDKINALYQQSPEKLITEVNRITGLDIKYYIHVNTDGLVDLVDAIGGVTFDVPIDMKYDDDSQKLHINLKAGPQKLDGNHAEQLVRFRHNNNGTTYPAEYGTEDIGRMRTQREFLKTVAEQMLKVGNISKVDDYIKIAQKYMKTNFDFNSLKDYAPYALEFNTNNLVTNTLPGTPEKCNGVWVYIHDKKETQTIVKEMFKDGEDVIDATESSEEQNTTKNETTEKAVSPSKIKVEILNGTSNAENLTNVKTMLQKKGYKIVKTGDITQTSKTTIINRTNQNEPTEETLKTSLGTGTLSNGNKSSEIDFTIVIGSDY